MKEDETVRLLTLFWITLPFGELWDVSVYLVDQGVSPLEKAC